KRLVGGGQPGGGRFGVPSGLAQDGPDPPQREPLPAQAYETALANQVRGRGTGRGGADRGGGGPGGSRSGGDGMTALVVGGRLVLLDQEPDLGLRVAARTDEVLSGIVQLVPIELDLRPDQLEIALERLLAGARGSPRLDGETGGARIVILQPLLRPVDTGLDLSRAGVRDQQGRRGPAQRLREGQVDLVICGADGFLRQPLLLRGRGEGRQRLGGLERRLIDERRRGRGPGGRGRRRRTAVRFPGPQPSGDRRAHEDEQGVQADPPVAWGGAEEAHRWSRGPSDCRPPPACGPTRRAEYR